MIKTSTQVLDFTENKSKQTAEDRDTSAGQDFESPSQHIINNILNYSRNLEIKKSRFVEEVEYIKS